ncbi:response regulator [Paracoccus ravus]|uniref:response regulator n=1 Tax=Paracoccus ravus TaxID=2447760 RepID=UPI001430F34D|nr:response regulator [Paracoccus ravus]
MQEVASFIRDVTWILWQVVLLVFLWKIFPTIRKLIESRAFTLKFAGLEISAQEATDQIATQIRDLQDQIIALRKQVPDAEISTAPPAPAPSRALLWVDDDPTGNALEIAQLKDKGFTVELATSTAEAMTFLSRHAVDVIISDMGRREGQGYVPDAGLQLLLAVRGRGLELPFVVYTSRRNAAEYDAKVRNIGGTGATASPVDLLAMIQSRPEPRDPGRAV